jgi:FkbM family methyltransferase
MLLRMETSLRAIARKAGLVPMLQSAKTVLFGKKSYEEAFDLALMNELKSGDVIYDVGANVGDYTEKFAQCVGTLGEVVAFEPSPVAVDKIKIRCQGYSQVNVMQIALADQNTTMALNLGESADSPVNSLAIENARGSTIEVSVARADSLVISENLRRPNLIKIDVEGFEPEVIAGFGALLLDPSLRAIFLEMHFTILDARGKRHAPAQIVELLRARGFKVRWTDASHLVAKRS